MDNQKFTKGQIIEAVKKEYVKEYGSLQEAPYSKDRNGYFIAGFVDNAIENNLLYEVEKPMEPVDRIEAKTSLWVRILLVVFVVFFILLVGIYWLVSTICL